MAEASLKGSLWKKDSCGETFLVFRASGTIFLQKIRRFLLTHGEFLCIILKCVVKKGGHTRFYHQRISHWEGGKQYVRGKS